MFDIMNRRRLFGIAGMLMACVVLTLGVLAMLPPHPGVTDANFNRIKKGMTKPEVSADAGCRSCKAYGRAGRSDLVVDSLAADDRRLAAR